MRPRFVKSSIVLIIGAALSLPDAFSADWNGSYKASGQCFCVGELSSSMGFIGKPIATVKARPAIANRSTDVEFPPKGSQWVIIDGKRYIRARAGMPAAGGEPGQRIVLDGLVYLQDDGRINPADIFLEQPNAEAVDNEKGQISDMHVPATLVANPVIDKTLEVRLASERQAAARQQREDARATARQIEAQRRRLRQQQLESLRAKQLLDMQELQRAKQQLEAESASRALAVLEERVKARTVERANLRQADLPISPSLTSARPSEDGSRAVEPPVAAASPASVVVTHQEAVLEAGGLVVAPTASSEESGQEQGTASALTTVSSALRLPAAVRASARNFRYLEALPVSYDVGGDGLILEGSTSSHSRLQYFGSLGITRRYHEFMAGAGYYLTPESASRLTFVLLAGIEYGNFELVDGQSPEINVDFDDSGVYLAASSRMVVNSRFELKAGIGYSSMFEGDAMFFGGGYLHLTRKLDLVTRFELGDNDLLGIGVRYYY